MQNSKKPDLAKSFTFFSVAVLTSLVFFSCSKEVTTVNETETAQLSAVNQKSPSQTTNNSSVGTFTKTVFVPCANGGAGENVTITGKINFVYQMTWTDHAFTLVYHDNLQDVTAVGQQTGESFAASGGTQGTVLGPWYSSQWVGSMIRQLRLTSPGVRFDMNYNMKLIVTPDGLVKVDVGETRVDCDVN